jgi:hypothetical protein
MADDNLQDLMTARSALVHERRNRAKTIANSGSITNEAMANFVNVQETIEAIDRAIEELEGAELEEELGEDE